MIGIKLKKGVTDLFRKIFLIVYCLDIYIAQRMCDEAVNDSLAAMKRIPGFVC